jgi:hypothetical protein
VSIFEVLAALTDAGITYRQDGYTAIPSAHCFATWRKVSRRAEGADGYALYWIVTYEIRIFYREKKTSADLATEISIEEELRGCENLESEYAYDPDNKLEITIYTFTGEEKF